MLAWWLNIVCIAHLGSPEASELGHPVARTDKSPVIQAENHERYASRYGTLTPERRAKSGREYSETPENRYVGAPSNGS